MNWVIILLRFFGHIPTFWLAAVSVGKYHTVRRFPDLVRIAPGSHLQVSLHIPAVLAWFLSIYNFITFGVAAFVPFSYSFVFLPFDLTFCALLLTTVIFQKPYIPKLPRICKHSSRTLANGYFAALAEADLGIWKPGKDADGNALEPPSPSSTCQAFYTIWVLEVVILTLYLISIAAEIFSLLYLRHDRPVRYPYYGESKHRYEWIWTTIAWPFHSISSAILYLKSSLRFTYAYVSRGSKDQTRSLKRLPTVKSPKEGLTDLEFEDARSFKSRKQNYPGQSAFEKLMRSDRVMKVLAKEFHANDIRHIGQAVPAIRVLLYNYKGPNSRDRGELIDNATCTNSEKTQCWACSIQICTSCTTQVQASASTIQQHMDHCVPYCHKCYFLEICRKPKMYCRPNLFAHSQKFTADRTTRSLCRPCGLQDIEKIEHRRAGRDSRELALLADQAIRCGNCTSGLPSKGPRWWVCNLCSCECKDECHY